MHIRLSKSYIFLNSRILIYIYKQNKWQKSSVYMSKFANLVQMSNCISIKHCHNLPTSYYLNLALHFPCGIQKEKATLIHKMNMHGDHWLIFLLRLFGKNVWPRSGFEPRISVHKQRLLLVLLVMSYLTKDTTESAKPLKRRKLYFSLIELAESQHAQPLVLWSPF